MKQNKTKIALLISQLMTLGGTERVTALLSHELSQYYDCSIITIYQKGESVYPIDNRVTCFNCNTQKKRLRYILAPTIKKIITYLKKEKIDVLLVIGRNNSLIPLFVKLFYPKIKLIFCEHNSLKMYDYDKSSYHKFRNSFYQMMVDHLSDKIVLLSKKELQFYSQKNPTVRSKLLYIYNIADNSILEKKPNYNMMSKKILSVGRIDYQKGYEYLVAIAEKVFQQHPDWQWDIYGKGAPDYEAKIRALIEEHHLEKNVFLRGTTNHLYDEYPKYAIYAMTSRWEGLPMVLLEAQANALPIVSFDLYSGPSDIVNNSVNGYLVQQNDIDDFCKRLCALIENPKLRKEMSQHTRDNIAVFSNKNVMKQWQSLINTINKS